MLKVIITIFAFATLHANEFIYFKNSCNSCHGVDANGIAPYPKLANKDKNYIIKKLKDYKNNNIKTPEGYIMTGFAKALSDEEIEQLAQYLSNKKESNKNRQKYIQQYDTSGDGGS